MPPKVASLAKYRSLREGAATAEVRFSTSSANLDDADSKVQVADLMLEIIGFLDATGAPGLGDVGVRRREILMAMADGRDMGALIGQFRHILGDLTGQLETRGQSLGQVEGLDLLDKRDPVAIIDTVFRRYPEMGWLTGDVTITPEASFTADPTKKTIGEQIFPGMPKESVVEFNRTSVGILNLIWVLQNDYDSFTACQKQDVKLTRESFEELRRYTLAILPEAEDLRSMIVYMVINDLGKIPAFIDKVRTKRASALALESITLGSALRALTGYAVRKDLGLVTEITDKLNDDLGAESVDHDVALVEGLQTAPEEAPSFLALAGRERKTLLTGLQARFNIGQFIQGENVPASLAGLRNSDQRGLEFYLLHALYDIAGAAGQFVQNGSAVMTEPTYQGFKMAIDSINQLLQGKSFVEVYDLFLQRKMAPCGLDTAKPTERALARLACMLRTSNPAEVSELQAVFADLHPNIRAILEQELNRNGVDDGFATLIYYSPAILANTVKSFKGEKKEALTLGLTTLARIFQEARISIKKRPGSGVYTVMAKDLAALAAQDPSKFNSARVNIEQRGADAEVTINEYPVIDASKFEPMDSLNEVPGKRIAAIGMGGGSDGCQAAILGIQLRTIGKTVPAIISVRTDKPSSQGKTGGTPEKRTVENYRRELVPGKVYEIGKETTGSGRFLENLPADDVPMFLVIDHLDGTLQNDINAVLQAVGGVDTVIGVDTGGDALTSGTGHDIAHATPDQDIRVLQAITALPVPHHLSCEMAIGIDAPDDAEARMLKAEARYFDPTDEDAGSILELYRQWRLDGTRSEEGLYGKTPFAFQLALRGKFGNQCLDLPKENVLSTTNPWRTFAFIQHTARGMFFMQAEKHLEALK